MGLAAGRWSMNPGARPICQVRACLAPPLRNTLVTAATFVSNGPCLPSRHALDVALGRTVTAVDVGLIHCRDDGFRAVKFRFANIAEAGFGAHVVQLADRSRRC